MNYMHFKLEKLFLTMLLIHNGNMEFGPEREFKMNLKIQT